MNEILHPNLVTDGLQDVRYGVVGLAGGFVGVRASRIGLQCVTLPQASHEAALSLINAGSATAAKRDEEGLAGFVRRLARYYDGNPEDFCGLELDFGACTPFRQEVLQAVRRIPHGEVKTYGQVASEIGRKGSGRAVGRVMALNPLCIVVPCHRVLASDGSLGGFVGGLGMKAALLTREGVNLNSRNWLSQGSLKAVVEGQRSDRVDLGVRMPVPGRLDRNAESPE